MIVYEHHAYELIQADNGKWWAKVYAVGDSPLNYDTPEQAREWAMENLPESEKRVDQSAEKHHG